MDSNKKQYIIIPDTISYSEHGEHSGKRLNGNERCLLGKIVSLSQNRPCEYNNAYFAQYIAVSERQIKTLLKNLREGGFIKITGNTSSRKIVPSEKTLMLIQEWKNALNTREENFPSDNDNKPTREENFPKLGKNTSLTREENFPHINKRVKRNRESLSLLPIPSLEEVAAEVEKEGYNVNAADFWNYYQKLGWQDSNGKPVRNWKAKLATWNLHSGGRRSTQTAAPVSLSAEEIKKQEDQRKAEEAEHKARLQAIYEARNKEARKEQTQ